jgi:hypothetical protein
MTKTSEKHALVEWRKSWSADKWFFTSFADGEERELLEEDIRVVLNLHDQISGYVEESKIKWARKQLLLERQKYLIDGYAKITKQLQEITSLLEEDNKREN